MLLCCYLHRHKLFPPNLRRKTSKIRTISAEKRKQFFMLAKTMFTTFFCVWMAWSGISIDSIHIKITLFTAIKWTRRVRNQSIYEYHKNTIIYSQTLNFNENENRLSCFILLCSSFTHSRKYSRVFLTIMQQQQQKMKQYRLANFPLLMKLFPKNRFCFLFSVFRC